MIDDQRVIDAEMLLFRTIGVIDSATGTTVCHRVESTLYNDYRERRATFAAARMAYTAAYKEAQQTSAGRRAWPSLAAYLTAPVTAARSRLDGVRFEQIEKAEALLERVAAVSSRQRG